MAACFRSFSTIPGMVLSVVGGYAIKKSVGNLSDRRNREADIFCGYHNLSTQNRFGVFRLGNILFVNDTRIMNDDMPFVEI